MIVIRPGCGRCTKLICSICRRIVCDCSGGSSSSTFDTSADSTSFSAAVPPRSHATIFLRICTSYCASESPVSTGCFGSQAVILPQIFRAAAMRGEAAPQLASWRSSQNGHKETFPDSKRAPHWAGLLEHTCD